MTGVASALTIPQWIVILAIPSVVIGIVGYRWIHRVMQATAVVVGVALVIMFAQGLRYGALPASETTWGRPSSGLLLAGVALLVIDMLAYGPFVSDYTRYLPAATSRRRPFGGVWRRLKAESVTVRLVPFVSVMAIGVLTACLGYQTFVTNLTNFLDVLLVVLIPWSAVNLTDYFLVRRGSYDVASFFTADGTYGRFAWRGLFAYTVGIAAEWPFVSQSEYTGPLVGILGGSDISWLVGGFAAASAYLLAVAVAPGAARRARQIAATAYSSVTPAGPAGVSPVSD